MDDMMLIIGNHTLKFTNPDEIINFISEISSNSVLNLFNEMINIKSEGLSEKAQGIFILPYTDEKYLNSNDQFSKEGFVSFRGVISNEMMQIDIGPAYFRFFPRYTWAMFHLFENIHEEIHKFFLEFLSKIGCSEFIYFPDSSSIAEFVSGKTNTGTYEYTNKLQKYYPPKTDSPFKEICTNKHLSYIHIKERLHQFIGEPAWRWADLVFTEDYKYKYLLEKIPSSYKY